MGDLCIALPQAVRKPDSQVARGTLRQDDAISVNNWVKAERNKGPAKSCVLFYKFKGQEHTTLDKSDFVLIIQKPFQRRVMKRFGANVVCMDATHVISQCVVKMITLLVVDEDRSAFPVASCFCSRDNLKTMRLFVGKIKESCGVIKSKVFVTSDLLAYRLAWTQIMGEPGITVLSPWSVERAWLDNMHSISDAGKRNEIHQVLKDLIIGKNEWKTFNVTFDKLLLKLLENEETEEFGQYLLHQYSSRREEWAPSYCRKMKIDADIPIENFQNYFKCTVKDGRVESNIQEIIQFAENKLNGKTDMTERHRSGIELSDSVEQKNDSSLIVRSKHNSRIFFKVESTAHFSACTPSCNLFCKYCTVCYDAMTCSCADYMLRYNVCEHIHAAMHAHKRSIDSSNVIKRVTDDEMIENDSDSNISLNEESITSVATSTSPMKPMYRVDTAACVLDESSVNHKKDMDAANIVVQMTDTLYLVRTKDKAKSPFTVEATPHFGYCNSRCAFFDVNCGVCYKALNCDCIDYTDLNIICKHIHAVIIHRGENASYGKEDSNVESKISGTMNKSGQSVDAASAHKVGANRLNMTVIRKTMDKFFVQNKQEPLKLFTVLLTDHVHSDFDCKLRRVDYEICYNALKCNCDDYELRSNICVHVRAVVNVMKRNGVVAPTVNEVEKRPTIETVNQSISDDQHHQIKEEKNLFMVRHVDARNTTSPPNNIPAADRGILLPTEKNTFHHVADYVAKYRHKMGVTFSNNVKQFTKTSFLVRSRVDVMVLYSVQLTAHFGYCNESCQNVCKDCEVCYKAATCSCEDYKLFSNICEHIHAMVYFTGKNEDEIDGNVNVNEVGDTAKLRPTTGVPQKITSGPSYDNVLRHIAGDEITDIRMTVFSYEVRSKRDARNMGKVTSTPHFNLCNSSCKKLCNECKICYKAMTCSCDDYKLHLNICEHIHAIKKHIASRESCKYIVQQTSEVIDSSPSRPTFGAVDNGIANHLLNKLNEISIELNELKSALNSTSVVGNLNHSTKCIANGNAIQCKSLVPFTTTGTSSVAIRSCQLQRKNSEETKVLKYSPYRRIALRPTPVSIVKPNVN